MVEQTEQDQIAGVIRRLAASGLPVAEVEPEVRARFDEWRDARVRDFVPIFVERAVRDSLTH